MTLGFLGLGIVVVFVFPYVSTFLGEWINVDTLALPDDTQADAIIILGGNTLKRAVSGVDLYRQGVAPQVGITGYNPNEPEPGLDETLAARDYAIQAGVPERDVILLSSTSTFEDAKEIANYVIQTGAQQLVIVSDWTHGRRAVCSIRAATTSSSLTLYFAATPSDFTPINWWQSKDGAESIFAEVIKMAFYMLRYGISMWGCFPGDPDLTPYPFVLGFGFLLCLIGVRRVHKTTYNSK